MTDDLRKPRFARDVVKTIVEIEGKAVLLAKSAIWLTQVMQSYRDGAEGLKTEMRPFPLGEDSFQSFGKKIDTLARELREKVDAYFDEPGRE